MRGAVVKGRALAAAAVAAIVIAIGIAGGGGDPGTDRVRAEAAPARAEAPAPRARQAPAPAWRRLEGVAPYGENPDALVRQRHDYPPDTPERLGPKIGRVLFDLEVVVDTVTLGHLEGERIHTVRGRPLDGDEQAAGAAVLQRFFDEATPVVDAALDGGASLDAAFRELLALRMVMNCDLSAALVLNRDEVFTLWPGFEHLHDEECFLTRPDEDEVIPSGAARR